MAQSKCWFQQFIWHNGEKRADQDSEQAKGQDGDVVQQESQSGGKDSGWNEVAQSFISQLRQEIKVGSSPTPQKRKKDKTIHPPDLATKS